MRKTSILVAPLALVVRIFDAIDDFIVFVQDEARVPYCRKCKRRRYRDHGEHYIVRELNQPNKKGGGHEVIHVE